MVVVVLIRVIRPQLPFQIVQPRLIYRWPILGGNVDVKPAITSSRLDDS